ncbi:hypothetical protein C8R47DRAFT_1067166 [Mycena vitilis]|nr:hypothetical protein C8R47DRAFT_1067166 [Mycena vitilis]
MYAHPQRRGKYHPTPRRHTLRARSPEPTPRIVRQESVVLAERTAADDAEEQLRVLVAVVILQVLLESEDQVAYATFEGRATVAQDKNTTVSRDEDTVLDKHFATHRTDEHVGIVNLLVDLLDVAYSVVVFPLPREYGRTLCALDCIEGYDPGEIQEISSPRITSDKSLVGGFVSGSSAISKSVEERALKLVELGTSQEFGKGVPKET